MSNLKEISKLSTTININKNEKLIKAAKHDDLELVQTLLKNNADVNWHWLDKFTFLSSNLYKLIWRHFQSNNYSIIVSISNKFF